MLVDGASVLRERERKRKRTYRIATAAIPCNLLQLGTLKSCQVSEDIKCPQLASSSSSATPRSTRHLIMINRSRFDSTLLDYPFALSTLSRVSAGLLLVK